MVGKERKLCWKLQVSWLWYEDIKYGIRGEVEIVYINKQKDISFRGDNIVFSMKFQEEVIVWIYI